MPHAIIRIAKIKTAGAAQGKTAHNYRQMETPNADSSRTATLNQEYINHAKTDYWTLAEARIGEAVTRKVRADQVRAVEVVMAASPEAFKRGQDGQVPDMRTSKWVKDNLDFLQDKYGAANVVSFTLHQDEKTPHIHAVVVPISQDEKGRASLSADRLFNPQTLRQLQTDYAAKMAPYGLERGVEGSRRHHEEMKHVYGQQARTAAELGPLVQAMTVHQVELPEPPLLGRDTWRAEQQARINAELAQQVGEAQRRAQEAANLAVANAGAKNRVGILEKQLSASEGLKQANFDQLQRKSQHVETITERSERLAMQLAQGGGSEVEALTKYGAQRREQVRQEAVKTLEQALTKPTRNVDEFVSRLKAAGYELQGNGPGQGELVHQPTGARFPTAELQPNGQPIRPQLVAAIERTAEQTRSQAQTRGRDRGMGMG